MRVIKAVGNFYLVEKPDKTWETYDSDWNRVAEGKAKLQVWEKDLNRTIEILKETGYIKDEDLN